MNIPNATPLCRALRLVLFCVLLAVSGASCSGAQSPSAEEPAALSPASVLRERASAQAEGRTARRADGDELVISMSGDIMMGTTYPSVMLPANDGRDLFRDVKPYIREADLAVGNLEGAMIDGGTSAKGGGRNTFSFRMPTSYGPLLTDAGYDFLSMANNHANDFGPAGVASTERVLDREGIKYAGVQGRTESVVLEKNGVRYGLAAFGHNAYTVRHTDFEQARRIIRGLKERADIVIVSMHGGAEGRDKRHLPHGTETFLGENRGNLRAFAHLCIDNGADVVYGHGPHIVRAVELYKDRFIAYSLGNFATPYGMNLNGITGYAPLVNITIDREGRFLEGKIHSFIQHKGVGPRRDPANLAAREIKQLTEADVPGTGIVLDNQGNIRLR